MSTISDLVHIFLHTREDGGFADFGAMYADYCEELEQHAQSAVVSEDLNLEPLEEKDPMYSSAE